jgi:predicted transposase YdaD
MEGKMERNFELAKSFKALGVDVETIARATGLSKDEVEKL